jgi:methylene-tetrahydromethanopterin dehydrogenase
MGSPNILHMITPLKHMSPFDVNMAIDAGYNHVISYAQVTLEEIRSLVQDAIFSRAPQDGPRTGLFIGGKNAILALDMMSEAWEAMVPPFAISIFADPAGSFTTAASMVACAERKVKERTGGGLSGKSVAVFGGSGVVAFSSAVIAALQGASVSLVGYDGDMRVKRAAADMQARFNVRVEGVDGSTEDKRSDIVSEAHVVFSAAAAGVRVLPFHILERSKSLIVVADVNAVPPSGIEGVNVQDNGVRIPGTTTVGIGPLTIGNVKYQTEAGLFRKMTISDKPLVLDFRDAYQLATEIAAR